MTAQIIAKIETHTLDNALNSSELIKKAKNAVSYKDNKDVEIQIRNIWGNISSLATTVREIHKHKKVSELDHDNLKSYVNTLNESVDELLKIIKA